MRELRVSLFPSIDVLVDRFSEATDHPAWALTDTRLRDESTVRRRRHLVYVAVGLLGIPVTVVAERLGMNRTTAHRLVRRHTESVRDSVEWAVECRRVEQAIREAV